MEFFHEPKIDWMGKKWYFIGLSIPLLLAGMISIAMHRGLNYGIDFRGGVLMQVQFASNPPLDKIRSAMSQKIKGEVSVQNFTGANAKNQVEIGTEMLEEGHARASAAATRCLVTRSAGPSWLAGRLDDRAVTGERFVPGIGLARRVGRQVERAAD